MGRTDAHTDSQTGYFGGNWLGRRGKVSLFEVDISTSLESDLEHLVHCERRINCEFYNIKKYYFWMYFKSEEKVQNLS